MKVIDAYVSQNANNKAAFDRSTQMFGDQLPDPDLIDALDNKFKDVRRGQTVLTVLLSMKRTDGPPIISHFFGRRVWRRITMRLNRISGDTLRKVISDACNSKS